MVHAHFGQDQAESHRQNNQESRRSVGCYLDEVEAVLLNMGCIH
jgi:hypothetical protein